MVWIKEMNVSGNIDWLGRYDKQTQTPHEDSGYVRESNNN